MTVREISTKRVITANPEETIVEIARRMRDEHVGAVVVVDSQLRPIGILTDRDIVVTAVAQSPDRLDALLALDVMTPEPLMAKPHEALEAALSRMQTRGVRRLPVIGIDGRLEGIVTFDDILKAMSFELSGLIGLVDSEQRHERLSRR